MKLLSRSEAETKEIGQRIGRRLHQGDTVCLYGELGAGKTTLVKGIAAAFGLKERDVTSASFTIIAEYNTQVPFYHIDLYRLSRDDVLDLGLDELTGSDGVAIIEWAERAEGEVNEPFIKVKLEYKGEDEREIEIEGMEI